MDEFSASLALRHTRGLGPRTWKRLLTAYGSAKAAAADFRSWAARELVPLKVQSEFGVGQWQEKAGLEAKAALDLGLQIVCFPDRDYPELLRQIPDPPLFLYYQGELGLLGRPCVAMVGSRQCSRYGLQMAESIASDLSRAGVCVVSGFAFGIDRAAHLGALGEVGSTIAVLGTGIDLVYPAANTDLWRRIAASGLIVSEFAPGTRPEGVNFPHRNRIVSGLSLGVLVVEGALGSGSLITAELALAQNREVFALPGPATMKTFQGCHQLIRQGACLVQSGEDILRELQVRLAFSPAAQRDSFVAHPVEPDDPDQHILFQHLRGQDQVHIDALIRLSGWTADKVSSTLLFMELQGLVKQLPGMYYALEP